MKRLVGYLVVMMVSLPLMARFHIVKNEHQLEKLVDEYEYCVVCFAPSKQTQHEVLDRDDKHDRKKEFRAVQGVVKATSDRLEYKKFLSKDIGFIMVDTASKYAQNLAHEFGQGSKATCLIFEQGAPDKKRKVIRPVAVKDLTRLLEQEGGSNLKSLLKERKEEASLIRQERIAQNYAYATTFPYWGGYGWGGLGWDGYGLGDASYTPWRGGWYYGSW